MLPRFPMGTSVRVIGLGKLGRKTVKKMIPKITQEIFSL